MSKMGMTMQILRIMHSSLLGKLYVLIAFTVGWVLCNLLLVSQLHIASSRSSSVARI
jgi:hypothetical protein